MSVNANDPALKVLHIFEALANVDGGGMGMMEICEKSGLSRSTTHRLLAALTESGYVVRDAHSKKYSLGLPILRIATSLLNNINLRKLLHPFLEELSLVTGETAHLAQLDGVHVVYIDIVDSPKEIGFLTTFIGKHMPLHSTATGKAILAHMPKPFRERVYREAGLAKVTEHTLTDEERVEAELDNIRRLGYSLDRMEQRDGVKSIGSPIFNRKGEVVAAISVAGPAFRFEPEDKAIVGALQEAALRMNNHVQRLL
ncbi:IclR family transcriptional regulator [Paenibacillus koleovorans]|uniref:IclR family transcriptional regulator n=1 Tax=Paenibacillus koleovorans TaxID=121608 RepID=UPI000FDA3742|nr:IclR family transcriptional regulator [Paenibacillus koleovorans]